MKRARTRPAANYDTLCDMLDLAGEIARGLPHADDPNHLELLQTLALSHLCAQRLAAERQRWGAQRR